MIIFKMFFQTIIQNDRCTPVFTAALFTVAEHVNDLNVHGWMKV